jgi:hypothetical protein
VVGVNQIVWDPDTNTLHAESDELLEQHTRYALIITSQLRTSQGRPLEWGALERFLDQLRRDLERQAYGRAVRQARKMARAVTGFRGGHILVASIFTTQSATAVLEKMRDQIKADTPAPADFLLGPGGTRTFFPLSNISSMLFNRQTGTAPTFAATPMAGQILALRSIPGVVGHVAFGKYVSPDYQTTTKVIPPVDTASGVPTIQSENEIYFNLFLPSGTPPSGGWPVAIFGHGNTASKQTSAFFVAADMAKRGIAIIAINAVPGAIAIQEVLEWSEWIQQFGNPVAYSPHLRKQPLAGVSAKSVIIQFAKGDQQVPNPISTAMLRAGDLADRAMYYRHDLAFASRGDQSGIPVPKDPHVFLLFVALAPTPIPPINFPAVADVGRGARAQIAEFFASDGTSIIDPDGAGPLFEVPIEGPPPEELNFIP